MMTRTLSFGALALSLTVGTALAQPQIVRSHKGTVSGEYFGRSLALFGDLDGDGIRDYAVGAPAGSSGLTYNGYVNIYSGATGNAITLIPLAGSATDDQFGFSMCNLKDITGDGVDEFVIGAPADTNNPGFGIDGYVRVYDGATRQLIYTLTPPTPIGGIGFGFSVCTADVNGTGADEIIVGAPWWFGISGNYQGAVYVFDALSQTQIAGFTGAANSNLGWSLSNIGDPGNGAQGFVSGAPQFAFGGNGYVEVFQGNPGGVPTSYNTISGAFAFGYAVASIDLNHSGVSNGFVVGSLYGNQVWSYKQDLGTGGFTTPFAPLNGRPGSSFAQTFGAALAPAGDTNNDGVPDIIVGCPAYGGIGYARIHDGLTGAKLFTHYGKRTGADQHGEAVSAAGDWNLDGRDSVLVGAPGWEQNTGPMDLGRAVLIDV